MSKIQNIFVYNPDFTQHILWQYDNAPAINSLINAKNAWYKDKCADFWTKIKTDFLNIKTADDWGLNLWGKILGCRRIYNVNGQQITLSKELYRRYIRGKQLLIRSNGTIPEIHRYCNLVFADYSNDFAYAVTITDNHDMTLTYRFNFSPTAEELALIYSADFFPTPAGVKTNIIVAPTADIFGFYGSEFQPFNQAPFWNGQIL